MNCVHGRLIRRCSAVRVRERARTGDVDGNERLTAAAGVVLFVLLAVEGVTIVFRRPLVSVHVFVGMLLIPLVTLKLGSTGYRLVRYYQGRRVYVEKGPPHPLMRFVVAPVLVVSTVGILASGVGMFVLGRRTGLVMGAHKASFVVWIWAMGIHVLVYLRRLPRLLFSEQAARGAVLRAGTVAAALLVGVVVAAATLPLARPWLHFSRHREETRRGAVENAG